MAKIKLLTTSINTSDLDDVPCATCGEIPPDRQSRVDCDASYGEEQQKLETFHVDCYMEELSKYA